jgi:diguanylate cyclase (GGDEF)-like protein
VVNDSLGYSAGDDLLRLVASRIRTLARPGDVVGRIGGDQFAVLFNDITEAGEAIRFSEKLQTHLAETPNSMVTPCTPRHVSGSPLAAAASTTPKT